MPAHSLTEILDAFRTLVHALQVGSRSSEERVGPHSTHSCQSSLTALEHATENRQPWPRGHFCQLLTELGIDRKTKTKFQEHRR